MDKGEIILYEPDGTLKLDVRLEDETVWLTQAQMGLLFGRDRTVIGRHIRNIFAEDELQESMVCANFAHTTQHGAIEGKTQTTDIQFYNLDVIISVGYRVKSKQLKLDLAKHNSQYEPINIDVISSFHDRFLIIDGVVYHIGASLKDLGKSLFAFSKMEIKQAELLGTIK
jgi:hypothetical protein